MWNVVRVRKVMWKRNGHCLRLPWWGVQRRCIHSVVFTHCNIQDLSYTRVVLSLYLHLSSFSFSWCTLFAIINSCFSSFQVSILLWGKLLFCVSFKQVRERGGVRKRSEWWYKDVRSAVADNRHALEVWQLSKDEMSYIRDTRKRESKLRAVHAAIMSDSYTSSLSVIII